MKKTSPNTPCPCGSKNKYKKCCQTYHKGAKPKTAFLLMKSRYTAYAVGDSAYIVNTTHENNAQYMSDKKAWKKEIDLFVEQTRFEGLEILEVLEGAEEAFVTFRASLSSGLMTEKSRFLKVNGVWLYEHGEIA